MNELYLNLINLPQGDINSLMSAETSPTILYPFRQCINCPLAENIIDDISRTRPYSGDAPVVLEKISLSCVVANEDLAFTGGVRLDSWIPQTDSILGTSKAGDKEFINDSARVWAGKPPGFCPQLEEKLSQDH